MVQRTFAVLYCAAFLDLCGVSMITMQLPNHLRDLGASHSTVGYIGSLYGFVQLFSSPVVGGCADKYGKVPSLLVCILMCGFGYLLLGAVSSLWVIAFLRIYLGVFKHPLNLIQSALSDLTSGDSQRRQSEAQGYYQSACSLAFIVSPPIAGYLMQVDSGYLIIGICVSSIYCINAVLIYTCLPTGGYDSDTAAKKTDEQRSGQSRWSFLTLSDVDQPSLLLLLGSRLLMSFSGLMWRNSYSLLYREVHHLTPSQIGWLISFNASVQTTVGFLIKYISAVIQSSFHQAITAALVYAVSMVMIANVSSLQTLYLVVLSMSAATMLSKISLQSYTNQTLGRKHTAYLVGINGSLTSFARLSSPVIVGYMMEHLDIAHTLYTSAACAVLVCLVNSLVEVRRQGSKVKSE